MGTINEMLNPGSVAFIGATDKEGSVGRAVFKNLCLTANCSLYPVNPNRKTIFGEECFPSIGKVPSHISLAVIATPAPTVPNIVRDCGRAGVAGAIILSAGFGEEDPQEKTLEKEIIEIRREYGLRIIGPNSLGIILPHVGLNATFLTINPKPGKIAFISRTLGDAILDWGCTMGIGFSMFASLGSMIDVGYGDLIDYLSEDYNTRSIIIYMENIGDPKRFISAARTFAMKKPVVVLKPGRSKTGARFINTRAGGQTGDDPVYDTVFKRVGVVRVMEMADLFNVAEVLDARYLPKGPRLAIVTSAGDVGIMATDTLDELGGRLAKITGDNLKQDDLFLPERWNKDAPADIVGGAYAGRYIRTIETCIRDDAVDGILVIYTARGEGDAIELARALMEMSRRTVKPIIVTWIGGERAAEGRRILLQNNVPAYATPEEAVKTYIYMYRYRRNIDLLYETPTEITRTDAPHKDYLKKIIRDYISKQRTTLDYRHTLDLLENYGIRSIKTCIASHDEEMFRVCHEFGFPLTITIRYFHGKKGDEIYSLASEDQMNISWQGVSRRLKLEGITIGQGAEIVIQKEWTVYSCRMKIETKRDPEFRTILVLSSGEKGADDICLGLPPLNRTLARRLLEGTYAYNVLKDSETEEVPLKNLEDALIGVSNLVVDFAEIKSLNLILTTQGHTIHAQDMRIDLCKDYDDSSPFSHLVISPYPSRYITTWNLPDGTEVLLRPVRPEDEPISHEMLSSLSRETLRVRFFGVPDIDRDLLIRFCNIDYDREIAILAEIEKDGKKIMIGGSRLICESDSGSGQFAILVHDMYHRMGLGAKFIHILIDIAREKKLHEIYGLVLLANKKMLALCRKLGFREAYDSQGVTRVSFPINPDM